MNVVVTNGGDRPPDEDLDGLEFSEEEWQLNIDRYRPFIESVTGIDPNDSLSTADCYRIGNRLEGYIDETRRRGEWTADLVQQHPEIDSLEQILWVSKFFRRCHENCLNEEIKMSSA